jgi:hypothetical protein
MKSKLLALLIVMMMTVGCAAFSEKMEAAGDAVTDVTGKIGTDTTAVVGEAVRMDLGGIIASVGTAVGNLISGVAGLIAAPISFVQSTVMEGVDITIDAVTPTPTEDPTDEAPE